VVTLRPGLSPDARRALLIGAAVAGLAGIGLAIARRDWGGAVLIAFALGVLAGAYRFSRRQPPPE
jgi:hypothetical protein